MPNMEIDRDNTHDADTPRVDPWLVVLVLSIVPMLALGDSPKSSAITYYHLSPATAYHLISSQGFRWINARSPPCR